MRWILGLALMAGPALAEGPDVAAALTGTTLSYGDGTYQHFGMGGETVFYGTDGKPSMGRWRVQAGQYCSVWPPSDHWACYEVKVVGQQVDFVAGDGSVSVGTLRAGPPKSLE